VSLPGLLPFQPRLPAPPINQEELLGLRLLSLHNLRFLLDLTANARAAIEEGRLAAYKAEALGRLASAAA